MLKTVLRKGRTIYVARDQNNKSISFYKLDDNLMKEYECQNDSLLLEKGYLLTRSTIKETKRFGYIETIFENLYLDRYLEGVKTLGSTYCIAKKYEFSKKPVKQLTENDLFTLESNAKEIFYDKYKYWREEQYRTSEDSVVNQMWYKDSTTLNRFTEKYILTEEGFHFLPLRDTLYLLDTSQYTQIQNNLLNIRDSVVVIYNQEKIDKLNRELEIIRNTASTTLRKILDEDIEMEYEISALKNQLEKFHEIISYKIDTLFLSPNLDLATAIIYINKGNSGGYQTYKTEAIFQIRLAYYSNNYYSQCELLRESGFNKAEIINNICDTSSALDEQIFSIIREQYVNTTKSEKKLSEEITNDKTYLNYKSEVEKPNSYEKNINIWNDYYSKMVPIQKDYLKFLSLVKDCKKLTDSIISINEKDLADIEASYANISSTWTMDVERTGIIKEEIKRIERLIAYQNHCLNFIVKRKIILGNAMKISINSGKENADVNKSYTTFAKPYNVTLSIDTNDNDSRIENLIAIQDSCLTFIELRKTINQNNTNITNYSKTASNIVKAYNTYIKNIDLAWNQEKSRNQALREIIQTQNELINVLSKPNIDEINKSIKELKDKSWENIKKEILK